MKKIVFMILLLLGATVGASAQGQSYTAGPFSKSGFLYVCPVPSGGTPCPSPSSIFTDAALSIAAPNPISVSAGSTVTFFIAAGQYTIQHPASGFSTVISLGGGGGSAFAGGLGASYQDVTEIATPANPGAGNDRLSLNSTTHLLTCLTSAGGSCMPTGGSPSFSSVTTGTNVTPLLMGTGGSLGTTGTGTITATSAAKWTTARLLANNSVDGSANATFGNAFIVQGTADAGLTGAQFLGALATGPLKNTTTTGVLSAAAAADIYGLWSNTCDSTKFLRGDGSCQVVAGSNHNFLSATHSDTVAASPVLGDLVGGNSTPAWAKISGPTTPAGVPQTLLSTPSGGLATLPAWALPGVSGRAITGTTATDTIAATDCNPKRIEYVGSVAVAITLPTATTLAVANCVFKLTNNLSTVNDLTITTTTWTCNGAATCVLHNGQDGWFYVDPNSATNWVMDTTEPALLAGTNITFTRTGTTLSIASATSVGSAHNISVPLDCAAASVSGTAYTCTTSPTFTPADGDAILFEADVANTGSATLNVNASSAATIKKQGGGTNLVANDLLAGQDTVLIYDGTNWQMQGLLGNAPSGGGTPCTTTALSLQYNNGGAFGCVTEFTYASSTITSAAAGKVDLSAENTSTSFKVPVFAGATSGANGAVDYDSTANITHIRTNAADSLAAATTSTSTTTTQPLFATAVAGIYNPRAIASGDLPALSTTVNTVTCTIGSTCTVNPPLDKSTNGLANPTADATFTYPISSTTGLTLAGTAPASVSTATGTNATSLLNVNGVTGGADSNATGTAGVGSSPTIAGGAGGAGTGTNAVGGAGGAVNLTPGNGGASAGTGANSNGGNVVVTPGTAGTGGSGTAGLAGVLSVAGPNAGFIGLTQGAANTTLNTRIPANTIIDQAPTAVTAYALTRPGVAAQGVITNIVTSAVDTQGFSGDTNHSTTVTIGSGTSITSTILCSTTNCPVGTYRVNTYIDITTPCGTSGTYVVNLIYTDDQGSKTIPININGTGAVSSTGVLTTTSTANFGEDAQILHSTGAASINYSTTAVACGTGGPMVGKLYLSIEPVQ